MSITFHPKVNELARSRQVAEQAENAFLTNWIISGLELSVPGSGRNVPVSSGKAFINGYIVDLVSMTLQVPDNATSTVYLGAHLDGQNNVNHFELAHDIPTSGLYVILGQVVVSGGNITSVNETGRSVEDRLIRTANIQDSAITTGKINSSAVTDIKIASDAVTTAKIQNDAVTLAKIQDINTARVLGRLTAGTGDVEQLTSAQILQFLNLPPAPELEYKFLDQLIINNTTLQNDNHLQFTLDANAVYYFNAYIWVTSGSGSYKYQLSVPTDSDTLIVANDSSVNSGNTSSGLITNIYNVGKNSTNIKNTTGLLTIRGLIKTVNAGTLIYKFAQNSSNSDPSITNVGSYGELTRLYITYPTTLNLEYLVIAGGGSGFGNYTYYAGGGGGAGGYRTNVAGQTSGGGATAEPAFNAIAGINNKYLITVGAGGGLQSNGSNSRIGTITCIGGGKGGGYIISGQTPGNGGSGGGNGHAYGNATYNVPGTGTTGEGYAGGQSGGYQSSPFFRECSGGGGGAGAVGQAGSTTKAGDGGAGLSNNITGSSVFRAGGGGGTYNMENSNMYTDSYASAGGNGGGGAGQKFSVANAISGTANTGGGGGGSAYNGNTAIYGTPGNGGSGVVIIRYPNTYTCNVGAGLTSTETTVGANKIRTFTAGTGEIYFT